MVVQKNILVPLNIAIKLRRIVANLVAEDRESGQPDDAAQGQDVLVAIDAAISEASGAHDRG